MAIVAKFDVSGMTADKYNESLRRLEAAGAGPGRAGHLYHVCYGGQDNLQVIDMYDSPQSLESFGKILGPILQGLGVEASPDVQEVYNTVQG